MILQKYNGLNELFSFQPISETEWEPTSRTTNNWAEIYGLDLSGCNIRNRKKHLQNFSQATCPVEELSDINRWNTDYWAAVLISPRHALVSSFRSNSNPDQELVFWGNSGTEYRPTVANRIDIGNDRVVLEFSEDLPSDVSYYKLVDLRWVPAGTKMWMIENQGRVFYKVHQHMRAFNFPEPYLLQEWVSDVVVGDICHRFRGDEDTPVLMTDPKTNETYLVGLWISGYPYYEDDPQTQQILGIDERIEIVKPSNVFADINKDGKVDGADLAYILGNFGSVGPNGDINEDGIVNSADMGALLASWGEVSQNVIPAEDTDNPEEP